MEGPKKTTKKRPGIFRASLRGRAVIVQVLRDYGLSWDDIAEHFRSDFALGNATGGHFASEWSRLKKEGLEISAEERAEYRRSLIMRESGYLGWGVVHV